MTCPKWAVVVVSCLAVACKKQEAPPPAEQPPAPAIPAAEIERGQDACNAYVEKVCACANTVPAMKDPCALATALPEAIEVAMSVTMSASSTQKDVKQAAQSIRKIIAECIQETAKLPAAGCPALR